MIYLAPEQVAAVTKAKPANVQANWPLVCDALETQGINHPLVQVGMAATIAAETGDFTPRTEKRAREGSEAFKLQQRYWPSGFFGRGYIQLTWRNNYLAAGNAIGVDLVGRPDLALEPEVAAKIATWFFKNSLVGGTERRTIHRACLAADWNAVRRGVNGPGYQKHAKSLERFLSNCRLLARLVEGFNG